MTTTVGITGGIGSGKSTFSNEIRKRNLKVLDSDIQVSNIYRKPNKEFLNYLKKIGLGKSIKKNKINKKTIADVIFNNKLVKVKLEKYIFKIVRRKRDEFLKKEKKLKTKIIFFDIPLLFENNLENDFDIIISIISKKKLRYQRLKISKKMSQEKFKNITKFQTSDVVRKKNSDIIVYNNQSFENYKKKINKLLNKIT